MKSKSNKYFIERVNPHDGQFIPKKKFNWTNKFGTQCHLLTDVPSVTDNDYATRTLTFEMTAGKDIVKTRNNVTSVVNKLGG